ncbi:MAG TPA: GDSL-type esterase/lipase family protein [Thermoanaerobaculia bacterium]|nr:GDSL-type esterase/lipase family protein [Thermoanaerobaculia bacterium]
MSALLIWIYGGQLFLVVAVLIPVVAIADVSGALDEHARVRRAARFVGLLAIALGVLSAPPLPLVLAVAALAASLAWAFWSLDKWTTGRRIAGAAAAIGCLAAATMEVPRFMRHGAVPRPSRLFVIGDSLSSGGFGEQLPWPAVIERIAALPVTNLSLAAGDTATALERQIPLLPRPGTVRECVFVEIGGNDMLDGVRPAVFAKNLDGILAAASAGGRRSVVMLELPLLPGRWSYGAIQRRLASKHNCELVPKRVLALVLLAAGNTSDGLHLTQQGHDALAHDLVRWLEWDRGRHPSTSS